MRQMQIDPDEIEVRTYPQEASHRCRKWEWKVWAGSKLLDSGMIEGTDSTAQSAGHAAKRRLIEVRQHG